MAEPNIPSPAPAPAPEAPSPAPAPAPSPGPGATPAPSPAPEGLDADNPFAELDAKFTAAGVPPAPAPEAPAPTKPAGKSGGKAGAKDAPAGPVAPAPELRTELTKLKSELDARNKAVAEMEAKIRDFEARGKDTEVLTKRLADMEKELEERRAELRVTKVETDPEFKKTYEKPIFDSAKNISGFIEKLEVANGDGTARKASWSDFYALFLAYPDNPQKVIAEANSLFGVAGGIVISHVQKLRELTDRRDAALEEERSNAAQREQEEIANRAKQQQQLSATWQSVNKDLVEKNPDFHDEPDDTEAIEARKKALEIIDAKPQNIQQKIVRDAHIRQRAAAYGPLKLKIARLEKELAALKEKAGGDAPPGKTTRPSSGGTPAPERSWEEDARATLT